jgi:diketogulonate reductase-like aldo/keto reductase
MEAIAARGAVRFVGASNVTAGQVEELVAFARVAPAFVQNRCYASRGWDRAVRAVCAAHDIVYQGFSLLTANRAVVGSRELAAIAKRHGRTPEQIVLRFAQQLGMLPLTGTTDPTHMRQDLAIDGFTLAPEEVAAIERSGTSP